VSTVTGQPADTPLCKSPRTPSISHNFIRYIFTFKGHGITDPARTNLDTPLASLDLRRFYFKSLQAVGSTLALTY
jgi:hypothetical protein